MRQSGKHDGHPRTAAGAAHTSRVGGSQRIPWLRSPKKSCTERSEEGREARGVQSRDESDSLDEQMRSEKDEERGLIRFSVRVHPGSTQEGFDAVMICSSTRREGGWRGDVRSERIEGRSSWWPEPQGERGKDGRRGRAGRQGLPPVSLVAVLTTKRGISIRSVDAAARITQSGNLFHDDESKSLFSASVQLSSGRLASLQLLQRESKLLFVCSFSRQATREMMEVFFFCQISFAFRVKTSGQMS